MKKENLLKALEHAMQKSTAKELAAAASVHHLLEFTFSAKPGVAFRAAWVLEHLAAFDFKRFLGCAAEFVGKYADQENQSCRRHYTKIMMLLVKKENSEALNSPEVVEATFEWLIEPRTPVAVKVNCLDILLMLRNRYEWITDELKAQVEFLMRDGSAAMQARGKKILGAITNAHF